MAKQRVSNTLVRFLYSGELFGMSNQSDKARITVKRIEIRLLFDFQINPRLQSMVDRLAQQRECLLRLARAVREAKKSIMTEERLLPREALHMISPGIPMD